MLQFCADHFAASGKVVVSILERTCYTIGVNKSDAFRGRVHAPAPIFVPSRQSDLGFADHLPALERHAGVGAEV